MEAEHLMDTAWAYARRICALAPLSVESIKRCLDEGCESSLDDGLELENTLGLRLCDTEDYQEGRRAFSEKRAPCFHGH